MSNEKKKEIAMDDLARIVQDGFLELKNDVEVVRSELKSDIKSLEDNIKEVKSDTKDIKANLNKKVDKFDHIELEYRVNKLEKKFA
jgi:regulator of replication initiation timing